MSKKAAAIVASSRSRIVGRWQQTVQPINDLPNPYTTVADYFKLPAGRTWGSTSAVEIDKDGTIDLGRRALRHEQLLRSGDRQDVAARSDAEVRRSPASS